MITAGTDEAGRGPLAGPVTAAAVILTPEQERKLLEAGMGDSKKLSEKKRNAIFDMIKAQDVQYCASCASPRQIDEKNILHASLHAMGMAVKGLGVAPDLVVVDGNFTIPDLSINGVKINQQAVIKADATQPSVMAASVIAKVLRDRIMTALDKIYPQYGFAKHKGYPTKQHIEALRKYGVSAVHRKSFNLFQD